MNDWFLDLRRAAAMSSDNLDLLIEEAFLENIPAAAVFLKCRNWGLVASRAVDIAEESSAEAYRRSLGRRYNDAPHYRSWITRTALNIAVDLLREQGRSIHLDVESQCPDSVRMPRKGDDLSEGLSLLDPLERAIVDLTFEDDMTLDEIAVRLYPADHRSPNAKRLRIKRLRDRALDKLRLFLSQANRVALYSW